MLKLQFSIKEMFENISGEVYEREMFERSEGSKFVEHKEREIILKVLKKFNLKRQAKILDVGAGGGRFSKEFDSLGFHVTALDISEKVCKDLKRKFNRMEVINGDIEKVKLSPENFDLIFSFRSFKYVYDKEKALCNLRTALRKNGYVIVEVPNLLNPFYFSPYLLAPLIYHLSKGNLGKYFIISEFYTKDAFKRKLEKAGFKVEEIINLFFFPHFLYSKIQNKTILRAVYSIDSLFSNWFTRSLIFVARRSDKLNKILVTGARYSKIPF
jgi:ubiquinone/menaquinone biosynthesis C-methylase UbiE